MLTACDGNGRVFVNVEDTSELLAIGTGRILKTLPISAGCDGAAFDPGTGTAYASNGEGTLTVVRQDAHGEFAVTATIPTRKGARTLTLDPTTHRIYLPTADFGPAPAGNGQPGRPPMLPGSFRVLVVGN